jgi:hypothetical protein
VRDREQIQRVCLCANLRVGPKFFVRLSEDNMMSRYEVWKRMAAFADGETGELVAELSRKSDPPSVKEDGRWLLSLPNSKYVVLIDK